MPALPPPAPTPPPAWVRRCLDRAADRHNRPAFIAADPISLPHRFTHPADVEIVGFWVAMLAWGQRTTILQKGGELIDRMDGAPHDFVVNHLPSDRHRFDDFRHRTFNAVDARCFLASLQDHYRRHASLEPAFADHLSATHLTVEAALTGFHHYFFRLPGAPVRTRKHVSTPARGSACKRLNMFLRWMVRRDDRGVDFGLWHRLRPSQLVCPCDVHVARTARRLGLLTRPQTDWRAALELTARLRQLDPADPCRYDFALFGMGIEGWKGD